MERKKTKVCHFSSVHRSDDVRIFLKECSSLADAGYNVYLVTANSQTEIVNNVNKIGVENVTTNRFTRMLSTSKAVYKKALELDADIYHFHDPELLPYGLKLKRKGKKVIYDAHEDVPKQILGKFWIPSVLRKPIAFLFKTYENYVVKKLDFVFTATPFIRDRFILVNKNSVDINNFPLLSELQENSNWESKAQKVCYIGGLSKIRGIEEVMDAMELLPETQLEMAGKFSPESFGNLIREKNAWKNVTEYGFVNRAETAKIMASCKAGIVTFLPLPNHVDAQPNKMFEYMSAGIPVIGSNFPLWKDIIEKNKCGICVDPTQPKEIAKAIGTIFQNDADAQKMGENGRKAVLETYNWGIESEKMLGIYDGINSSLK
jgi:glycosyltransferase involved in cell wall biosynthesis